jgi:hypothetical protein
VTHLDSCSVDRADGFNKLLSVMHEVGILKFPGQSNLRVISVTQLPEGKTY